MWPNVKVLIGIYTVWIVTVGLASDCSVRNPSCHSKIPCGQMLRCYSLDIDEVVYIVVLLHAHDIHFVDKVAPNLSYKVFKICCSKHAQVR